MNHFEKPVDSAFQRNFMARALLAVVITVATLNAHAQTQTEPFWGEHQAGITTPMQSHTYFMAFDLQTTKREDVIALLKAWTDAAASMTQAPVNGAPALDVEGVPKDSGATVGLSPARLTITFGFGPGLFEKDGVDRYGLAARRPAALADLPRFAGDQLVAERTGGDLSVQACSDDPQVVEYAIRRLTRLANGIAKVRWAQPGFGGNFKPGETPRNQMGFKDGTLNVSTKDDKLMHQFIWVGEEGPAWMRGGSYMVIRPTRIALEHWDQMKLGFQEQTIGRQKYSGAPIGKQHEMDPLDLKAVDKDGNPVTAEISHAAMAAPENNDGAQILRRAYSYDNGLIHVAERWPPWLQTTTFDAGLLFQCYQRDPRTGFIKIFSKMSQLDMLNQFTTPVGSGLFAAPPGAKPGEYIGQHLFE
jgi:deferrochelatase/peroxidase EfeB